MNRPFSHILEQCPNCEIQEQLLHMCGAFALRTAMEIGNGNIASVRLAAIFVRMGTLVTDTVQIGKAIRFLKCEQVKMRSSTTV